MTIILDIKIRLNEGKENLWKNIHKLMDRINLIEKSIERKDYYDQIEETKEFIYNLMKKNEK
jgi:hypothetical protein